jgi:hypothetical protein
MKPEPASEVIFTRSWRLISGKSFAFLIKKKEDSFVDYYFVTFKGDRGPAFASGLFSEARPTDIHMINCR